MDQTRRLGSYACIVVWGANNEVEQSLEWYPETRDNHDRFIIDYAALFFWTMRKIIQAELPHALFLDGSPSNGVLTIDPLTKRYDGCMVVWCDDTHTSSHPHALNTQLGEHKQPPLW